MYDLPSENPEEPGLPDEFHLLQPQLLLLTFQPPNWQPEQVFSAADLNLYYDVNHPLWYKRPDWFGAVGVPRLYDGKDMRLSYVIWQEKVTPLIIVELLSPGTERQDLGEDTKEADGTPSKWEVYEKILRVPYYAVFSRYTNKLQAFRLVGDRYEPIALGEECLPIPEAELSLGLWQGSYRGIARLWLRWFTLAGELIALDSEELTATQQELAAAKRETEKLAARLRALGIDPDKIAD
jgi:Uma2 family endonuclease